MIGKTFAVTVRLLGFAVLVSPAVGQVDWSRVSFTGPPQSFAAHAYDLVRNRLVVFGGANIPGTVFYDTTWEWDGGSWVQRTPITRPSARERAAMTYDRARGNVVLFGGSNVAGTMNNETWTWDGVNWQRRFPAASPPIRSGSSMAFDPVRQVVVLFGGFAPTGTDWGDLWEWNGTNWSQRFPTGAAPQPRGAHRLIHDAARGEMLIHGGFRTPLGASVSDTWLWNGTSWRQGPVAGPGSICDQATTYDAARERIVQFGGLRVTGGFAAEQGGTWEWDGVQWLARNPLAPPSVRTYALAEFDPVRNRVLMVGGAFVNQIFQEVWALTPTNPASITTFGAGCAGANGVPTLGPATPGDLPWMDGSDFTLRLQGDPAAPFGFIGLGFNNQSWQGLPLPFGLAALGIPGCDLLVSVDVPINITMTGGVGVAAIPTCVCPGLIGAHVYFQGAVVDASGGGNIPLRWSAGVDAVLGAR